MVAAANATATRIGAHLGHRELILWFPLFIAGLAFEHIYAASAVPCEYDPYFYDPPSGNPEARLENVGNARSQYMRVPQITEIMSWLDNNCLQTTQPVVSRIFRTFGWLSGTRPWLTR